MDLLSSSSCNQSTMPVDGGDGADYDVGNSVDANNEDHQHTNRENGTVSTAISNPCNNGRIGVVFEKATHGRTATTAIMKCT